MNVFVTYLFRIDEKTQQNNVETTINSICLNKLVLKRNKLIDYLL